MEWISVKDRMPGFYEYVVIKLNSGDFDLHIAYRKDHNAPWWKNSCCNCIDLDDEKVTHWMLLPLPNEPKGE